MARNQFHREILEQPQALARILSHGKSAVEEIAGRVRRADPKWAMIAARGSSDNAARYGQYLLGAHNRLGVGLAVPSLFTLYQAPPALAHALVIGISQSGQSPDIVAVLDEGKRQGAVTVAITNDENSPLARAAEHHLPLFAGEERAVAATKTYTNELMALAMLSAGLEASDARWGQLEALPASVAQVLTLDETALESTVHLANAEKFLVLGRGFNYSTAFEIALKIKETSYVIAEPYSAADLLHGPIAMVDAEFPVVCVAPSGAVIGEMPRLIELLEERRAELVVISDRDDLLGKGRPMRLPPDVPEWLSPIVTVVPGQLFALGLALARGNDPDAPRGLSKVTRTH